MIFKTLLAILITASVAAAAVYFGSMPNVTRDNTARVSALTPSTSTDMKSAKSAETHQTSIQKLLHRNADKNTDSKDVPKKTPNTTQKQNRKKYNSDTIKTFGILMMQAERIEEIALQDQAFVDVVHYALRANLFDEAQEAMLKIRQPELRDTSRGQMGIVIARQGQHKRAFSIIDQVETDGLRDVLRLQVIEAIAAP
ncbi:MAG: hypothetical protein COA43_01270 [Robiginitomaculum sp.]|nr:MAG: hypothetical protein COA43_01270 [Robiginitomaculum sp.]